MKITDVKKSYGSFILSVSGLSLTPGAIHGLVGPNGGGKTTLMKLMAGLEKADTGTIDREGLTQRDITMAPRKPYFLHDTVYRNLVYPLALRKIQPDREQVERYLYMAGLSGKRGDYAPGLSTGEQQKLSLIRAMIFSPGLILIDEAFSNLDMESAEMFEGYIKERQKTEPATWVVISHQLSHIRRMCSRVLFMHGGTVKADGPAEEIFGRPDDPDLKRYLRFDKAEA